MDEQPVELSRRPLPGAAGAPVPVAGPRRLVGELASMASAAVNAQVTRKYPVSLVHFVTRRCNARCSFCFIDFDNPSPKSAELTLDEVEQLTRTVGPQLRNVNLTGGEPFLRSDLVDIVRAYYRNAGVQSVYITSNGAFPDRVESLARAVAAEFPDRQLIVSLSLDAFPEEHDAIRKVEGLFDKAVATYRALLSVGGNVTPNVGITVSHENHGVVHDLYRSLVEEYGIRAVTAIIVRDEGVYEVPESDRAEVLTAYRWLTSRIVEDQRAGRLDGYDEATLLGRLMNRKNELLWDIVADTYLDPHFVSTCYAGSLFGVVDTDGTVHPCEVLDKPLGNLRDYGMDLGALWRDDAARSTASWIKDSKCNCSYECAWGFNILGNARYQPQLLAAALKR